ncbi:MAG: hypothetical protein R3F14_20685 [Polyangiaceae bacterium]
MAGQRSYTLLITVLGSAAMTAILVDLSYGAARGAIDLGPWVSDGTYPSSDIWPFGIMVGVIALIAVFLSGAVPAERPSAGAAIVGFSVASMVVLALLGATSLVKAGRYPAIEDYLLALRTSTLEIPPPGAGQESIHKTPHGLPAPDLTARMKYLPGPEGVRSSLIGDMKLVQHCEGAVSGCKLAFAESSQEVASSQGDVLLAEAPIQGWGEALRFAKEPGEAALFLARYTPPRRLALSNGWYRPVGFSPQYIAARTSPPRAWLGTGLAGLFIVALIHLLCRRLRRRRSALRAARKGTLEADGRVTFEDGSVAQLEGPPALPCGPVLVLGGSAGVTYRHNETLSERDMLTGTVDEHLEELRLRVLRYNAAAACVACLSAAPLVGALLVGLVV